MTKIITGNTDFSGPTPLEQKQNVARMMEMLKNSTGIKCEIDECGNDTFIEVVKWRKVSGLVNGTGKDMLIPVPVYACANCGHVNALFSKNLGFPVEETEKPVDTPTGE